MMDKTESGAWGGGWPLGVRVEVRSKQGRGIPAHVWTGCWKGQLEMLPNDKDRTPARKPEEPMSLDSGL